MQREASDNARQIPSIQLTEFFQLLALEMQNEMLCLAQGLNIILIERFIWSEKLIR